LDTVLSGIDVNLNPKGSISGRLTDSVGSPVVPFAGVVASRNNFECCEYWYAPTDETGTYKIVDLQTGDYKLRGGGPADQYALVYYTASGGSPDINQAEAVPVVYGLDTSVAEFHLLRLGSISGRVTDMVGAPIVGAEVRANFPQCGGCTPPSVLTDTGGNYRIDGLQPEDYLLGASAWGYVSQFFSNAGGAIAPEDATLIYPNLEEDVTGIDFRLPRPARVEGRVLDVAGDPVQGATVAISIAGCPGCGGGASTDANGEYIFWSFPPGDITLYAYKSGYYTAMYWTSDGGDQWQPEIIHVADGAQLTGYDFTLRMPGYVQERDVNCDGDVDAVDALRILRHVAGLYPNEPPGCPLIDSGNPVQGDVNCDKIADAVDALGILRYVAGLSTGFPLGCPPPKS
jgi:protocatechuate 3,4-dioxygenase beta subunit